jgi:hypothetical protein
LVYFRDRTNVDIYPLLPIFGTPFKIIGNQDQNSYTGFYRILLQSEERFTSEEELEENSVRLVQSYATYTNSKGRRLKYVTEDQDNLSTNYVPWTTWKPKVVQIKQLRYYTIPLLII